MPIQVRMDGAWRTPTGYWIKAGGEWVLAKSVFVNQGGWKAAYQKSVQAEPGSMGNGKSTYTETSSYVYLYSESINGSGALASMVLDTPVDLTNIKTVRYMFASYSTLYGIMNDVIFTISRSKTGTLGNAVKSDYSPDAFPSTSVKDLDVSDLSGWYYIRIHSSANPGTNITRYVYVYGISTVDTNNNQRTLWLPSMG